MKVAILCGGKGTRFREVNEVIPKPMAPIGNRVIDEDAPEQLITLSGVTPGAANENQTVTIDVASRQAWRRDE